MPKELKNIKTVLDDFNSHYSQDNISKRNSWMKHIDEKEKTYDNEIKLLSETLNKVNHTVVDIQIDNKRSQIIDFARIVSDENIPVTREQFNRIFKMYTDYERIISENGMTNGEIEVAHSIIVKSYKKHMENHTFVEDFQD